MLFKILGKIRARKRLQELIRIIYFIKYRIYPKIYRVPSIISRDCIGGVLYNRMGQVFTSPTINLYMNNEDFIAFCLNLKDYLNNELKECFTDLNYPVGKIQTKTGSIHICFMHYQSFEEAKASWDRRKARIDYDNIRVILNAEGNVPDSVVDNFKKIPYKKILLSSNLKEDDCIKNMKCYREGYNGSIVEYTNKRFPVKRYIDEVNWLNFLFR